MDKRDIASQAEKYKREMMKLYGRSAVPAESSTPEAVPVVNVRPEAERFPEPEQEPEREMVTEPEEEPAVQNEESLDERYPEPDLSELESDLGRTADDEAKLPDRYISDENMGNAKGYILVNVRTGDDSEPVQNATVHITAISNGSRMLMATDATNESGVTRRFEVPVPEASFSQAPDSAVRPYNLFDISVTAEGFFNARSVDVPVFEGITSVQTFSMVPVPLFMKSGDETVIYYNSEPNL